MLTLTDFFILVDHHKGLSALILAIVIVFIMVLPPLMNRLLAKSDKE